MDDVKGSGVFHTDLASIDPGWNTYKIPVGGLLHEIILGFDPPHVNINASNPPILEVRFQEMYSGLHIPIGYIRTRWEQLAKDE